MREKAVRKLNLTVSAIVPFKSSSYAVASEG